MPRCSRSLPRRTRPPRMRAGGIRGSVAGLGRAAAAADPERCARSTKPVRRHRQGARHTLHVRLHHPPRPRTASARAARPAWRVGTGRREHVSEPEDHISALCDAMRWLIEGKSATSPSSSDFFKRLIDRRAAPLCDAIEASAQSCFLPARRAVRRELSSRWSKTRFEMH